MFAGLSIFESVMNEIIAFLEQRIAHLIGECRTNPRSGYADAMRWRLKEAQYLLDKIRAMEAKP